MKPQHQGISSEQKSLTPEVGLPCLQCMNDSESFLSQTHPSGTPILSAPLQGIFGQLNLGQAFINIWEGAVEIYLSI